MCPYCLSRNLTVIKDQWELRCADCGRTFEADIFQPSREQMEQESKALLAFEAGHSLIQQE